jgi:hypothetical protein
LQFFSNSILVTAAMMPGRSGPRTEMTALFMVRSR